MPEPKQPKDATEIAASRLSHIANDVVHKGRTRAAKKEVLASEELPAARHFPEGVSFSASKSIFDARFDSGGQFEVAACCAFDAAPAEHPSMMSLHEGIETRIDQYRDWVALHGSGLQTTVEAFRKENEKGGSVDPEILRAADELNMHDAKQFLRVDGGPYVATWSSGFEPAPYAQTVCPPLLVEPVTCRASALAHIASSAAHKEPLPQLSAEDAPLLDFLKANTLPVPSVDSAGPAAAFENGARETLLLVSKHFEEQAGRAHPFEEVVRALLQANERQLADLSKDERDAFIRALNTSFCEALFDHQRTFTASYVNDADLQSVGVKEPEARERILTKLGQQQLLGLVGTRKGALWYACRLANLLGIDANEAGHSLLERGGGDLGSFVAVRESSREDHAAEGYVVRRFTCRSREQFRRNEPDKVIRREICESGNYPALAREMLEQGIGVGQVIEKIRNGEALNLVELDSFCEVLQWKRAHYPGTSGSLADAGNVSAAVGAFACVEREGGDPSLKKISLCVGYQGGPHVDNGVRACSLPARTRRNNQAVQATGGRGICGGAKVHR